MCHAHKFGDPSVSAHFLQQYFDKEASKRKWHPIYQFVDIRKDAADISADIFNSGPTKLTPPVPQADVVYAPDCGGAWSKDGGWMMAPYDGGKMTQHIEQLKKWVADDGYLYVSKLTEKGQELLKSLQFEKVKGWPEPDSMWRIQVQRSK